MIFLNDTLVKQNRFPDGTISLNHDISDFICMNEPSFRIRWLYDDDSEMFSIMCIMDLIKRHFKSPSVCLDMPYCPNARMDRIKSSYENFSLKVFCNWLNSLGFDMVFTTNIHSNVAKALIDNCNDELPEGDIVKVCEKYHPDMLFFPDEGAYKRYSDMDIIKERGIPVAFGIKRRDWKTGNVLGLDVVGEDFKDRTVLIIDDICSKGTTFKFSAIKLRELGVKDVALYVTHCEDNITNGELLTGDYLSKIYTTDSICHIKDEKIEFVTRLRNE